MTHLESLFRRSTHSTHFIPEIDGLRFYAIMTVVIFHLNTTFSREIGLDDLGISLMGGQQDLLAPAWWLIRLDLGVKVFFAISGFVLALPFLRQYLRGKGKVNLKSYFYRRLTRLEPPFIVSLVIFLVVHVWILNAPWQEMLPHFGAGLVYGHAFIYGYPSPINPVTWSLETEAQFYILVPLFFALLFYRKKHLGYQVLVLTAAFAGSIVLRHYFTEHSVGHLRTSILAFFSNFLVGIVFAILYLSRKAFFERRAWFWDLFGVIALFVQFYFYKPQHDYLNNFIFNLSIFGLMTAVFKGRFWNWFFTRPLVYIIGGMCYSIYLLHYAFFHLLVKYTALLQSGLGYQIDLLIQMTVAIPVMLSITSIFYLIIEKPCMDKNWPFKFRSFIFSSLQSIKLTNSSRPSE